MKGLVLPSDFRLTFADADFTWAGERRPGLPLLRWRDGTICEPVLAYFGYSAAVQRVRVGSMKVEAYALREWLAFIANRQRRWDEADDMLLAEWRECHRERIENGTISSVRVAQKLESVYTFYKEMPEALPFDEHVQPRKLLVGIPGNRDGVLHKITSKISISRTGVEREVWSGAERKARGIGRRRPTPDEAQVVRILTWLRSKSLDRTSERAGVSAQAYLMLDSERDWLIGRCMAEGGLRADEVACMSLDALAKALRMESIPIPEQRDELGFERQHPLDALGRDPDGRALVLAGLEKLVARRRTCLFVEVTGKGRKTRSVPFSIDLMRDLLEVGVWTVRRARLSRWTTGKETTPPRLLFLSAKTKARLKAGTVGDLMKQAFKAAKVEGSGHRLRAHFATMMAVRLLEDTLAQNNLRYDRTVENLVLERLAEALGHSQTTTTLRHYVNMATLRHFGNTSRARVETFQGVQKVLLTNRQALSPDRMVLVGKVVEALAVAPADAVLPEMIVLALADAERSEPSDSIQPSPTTRIRAPHLRVVANEE